MFHYLLVVIADNCKNNSENDKLLVNQRHSECHVAVIIKIIIKKGW